MMKKKGAFSVLGIVLVLTLALLALTPGVPSSQTKGKPVVIGNLSVFTGRDADTNPWLLRGAELAISEFGGKVAGREIKLASEDSASDPTVAADKTKKLLEVDKADAVIGPLPAAAAFPVATLLKPHGYSSHEYHGFPGGIDGDWRSRFCPQWKPERNRIFCGYLCLRRHGLSDRHGYP